MLLALQNIVIDCKYTELTQHLYVLLGALRTVPLKETDFDSATACLDSFRRRNIEPDKGQRGITSSPGNIWRDQRPRNSRSLTAKRFLCYAGLTATNRRESRSEIVLEQLSLAEIFPSPAISATQEGARLSLPLPSRSRNIPLRSSSQPAPWWTEAQTAARRQEEAESCIRNTSLSTDEICLFGYDGMYQRVAVVCARRRQDNPAMPSASDIRGERAGVVQISQLFRQEYRK